LPRWFASRRSAAPKAQRKLRIGIPRVLNIWSTHQFWIAFLCELGINPSSIVFSGDTSEEQGRQLGKGRGTVDCCYPVKCMAGHYGELLYGQRNPINVLFSPLIYSLPSLLQGHVQDSQACPRVMAGAENIRAGFLKERDAFAEASVKYVSPLVSMAEPILMPRQLYAGFKDAMPGLTLEETKRAIDAGFAALESFNRSTRARSREILAECAHADKPCLMVLARPYHMDPGIGHEIEVELQAYGYPIIWMQYFPTDPDLMDWMFGADIRAGVIKSPFDIADVWPSSYSANTNELMWGAKAAIKIPWVAGVIRLSSYECGMDQPTYTPVQQIIERSGTLFFSFQELDATKPAGSLKIRVETIGYYMERYSTAIIARKKQAMDPACPLLEPAKAESSAEAQSPAPSSAS
jgi:predicted nucleotide-binding protein (sugar kinase/HSP70/actin superfamily)